MIANVILTVVLIGLVLGVLAAGVSESYALAIGLGVATLAAFGILWERRRVPTRPCRRCGRRVAVGQLDCPYCEFDFRTIG